MSDQPKKRGRKPKEQTEPNENIEAKTQDKEVTEQSEVVSMSQIGLTQKPLPSCKTCVGFKPRKGDDGWCIMLPPSVNGFPVINQDLRCLQHRSK